MCRPLQDAIVGVATWVIGVGFKVLRLCAHAAASRMTVTREQATQSSPRSETQEGD